MDFVRPQTLILGAVFALACLAADAPAQAHPPSPAPIKVLFSPKGGCTTAVVDALKAAKASVMIQAYGFTSRDIAFEAVQAKRRGVPVRIILDKSNKTDKYSSADFLVNMGVSVWIDGKHAIAHDKVMVIDSALVVTGSFNFTKAAEERNSENLLLISDKNLAAQYEKHWSEHLAHSTQYVGKTEPSANLPATVPKILAISATSDDKPKIVRWGYSAEAMMQQIALSGEKMVWVGDPDKDATNDRKAVFAEPEPAVYAQGSKHMLLKAAQVPPPDRHMMVVLKKDDGPSYAEWVRQQRFGYVIHAKGVKCLWYGYPTKERDKYLAEQRIKINDVPDAENQE